MSLAKIAEKVTETDILIVGGGMGGCCLAAKAAEHGLDVTIVEKANSQRSGSAAAGLDHQNVSHFPIPGVSVSDLVAKFENRQMVIQGYGRWEDPNLTAIALERGLWGTEQLEKLGIPMRWDNGEWYFIPGAWWENVRMVMRVHWQNIKPMLSDAAKKKGAKIIERTMIVDLLTNNGRVVGATAVNTRTGEFSVIKAKATIIATGHFARCYEPETPSFYKYKLRYHWCPASASGDGWAMSYRAGAELANMDVNGWAFRIRDDPTISFGNFTWNDGITCKYYTWDGQEIGYATAPKYTELERQGKTPLYNSLDHLPADFHKRIEIAYADERLVSYKIAEDRGFDPKTHRYEMMANKPHNFAGPQGVNIDDDSRTITDGLFATGKCAAGGFGVTFGGLWLGDNIHKHISNTPDPTIDEGQVEEQKEIAFRPTKVKDGTHPMELESAVRYTCERYVSQHKSEGKLREGIRRLGSLKREFLPKLEAKNPHYLMRALECRNVIDLAEVHINAVLERKESRGNFIRMDYPERDKALDHMITYQRLEKGKPVLEKRKAPDLRPEFMKK